MHFLFLNRSQTTLPKKCHLSNIIWRVFLKGTHFYNDYCVKGTRYGHGTNWKPPNLSKPNKNGTNYGSHAYTVILTLESIRYCIVNNRYKYMKLLEINYVIKKSK